MKISNELLSWVFGCQCEFVELKKNILFSDLIGERSLDMSMSINIYDFINLAKVKAFEARYEVVELGLTCSVYQNLKHLKQFEDINSVEKFNINNILKALEWVCSEVRGE